MAGCDLEIRVVYLLLVGTSIGVLYTLVILGVGRLWLFARLLLAKTSPEPLCGRCGYCVRGLISGVCPECGTNLAASGIIRPGALYIIGRGGVPLLVERLRPISLREWVLLLVYVILLFLRLRPSYS